MFIYCENNPIMFSDPSGHSIILAFFVVTVVIVKVACTIIEQRRVKKELSSLPKPKADISKSFRTTLRNNANTVKETTKSQGFVESSKQFYNKVKNSGEWDLKQKSEYQSVFAFNGLTLESQDIGNIHYGYTGKALGLPNSVLLSGAGYAQIRAGTSNFLMFMVSNGDDLRDQMYIMYGIRLYNEDN